MNPTEALQGIPQSVRKAIYTALGVVGLVVAGTTAFYGATPYVAPIWLPGAVAAYGVLATPGFWVATSNTKPKSEDKPEQPVEQPIELVDDTGTPGA